MVAHVAYVYKRGRNLAEALRLFNDIALHTDHSASTMPSRVSSRFSRLSTL
jgi:hypothetical protein